MWHAYNHSHNHTIHKHQHHHGWDNSIQPVLRVAPGESVEFEVFEASGGQLSPASTVADVGTLDFSKINPVTGPVFIDGAEPGDVLKVTLLSFKPSGWDGPPTYRALVCWPMSFRIRTCTCGSTNRTPSPPLFSGSGAKFRSSHLPARLVWHPRRPACTASCRPAA